MNVAIVTATLLTVNLYMWLFSWAFSTMFAPGTRGRFAARTVRRPTQWLAALFYLIATPAQFFQHDYFWGSVYIFATYVCWKSVWEFYHDDEDDAWKRGKKKLKKAFKKLVRRARAMKPAFPTLAPAGGAA